MHVVGGAAAGRQRGRAVKYYIYSDPSAAPDRLAIDQSDLSNCCPAKEIQKKEFLCRSCLARKERMASVAALFRLGGSR